jgi:cellulose biosynthesis protein BcsQ
MTTLALFSNKGGVGKTATAVNLAYLAAESGKKTLICDLDPQSSTTFYFRVKPKLKRRARGLTKWSKQLDRSIKGTDYENLDLLPADFTHRNLDITFDRLRQRKHRLDIVLAPLQKQYDLIFLDCPPTINILAENIINASDYLLVPLIPTPLSLRTYEQLLAFLKGNGYKLDKVFAFFSMVDMKYSLHREMAISTYKQYHDILWSPIPYLRDIEQMGVYREPVPAFAADSPAAQAYYDLWGEIQRVILGKTELENN